MWKRLTQDEHEAIARAYLDYERVRDICERFNISPDTVFTTLKILGIKTRGISIKKLSWNNRNRIVAFYRSGASIKELAEKFNVSGPSISNILKINGVTRRPRKQFIKIYSVNEKAFDNLNERSLYWMGFFAADGSIQPSANSQSTISLHLGRVDTAHIYRFRRFLKSTHKVQFRSYKGFRSARIQIRSDRLARRLLSLGVKPKNGATIALELARSRHFWRGFIDGDGSVGFAKRSNRSDPPYIHVTGIENMLDQFLAFIRTRVSTQRKSYCIANCASVRQVSFQSLMAAQIVWLLYCNAKIALPRKNRVAQKIMHKYQNKIQSWLSINPQISFPSCLRF